MGLVLVVGLVVAELTDNVVDRDGLAVLDGPWHRWLLAHRSPALTDLMAGVSTVGSTALLAVLAACAAGWLALRRQWRQASLVTMTTLGAGLLVPLFKHLVARPRPPVADRLMVESSWSYPSGHSLGAAAVIGVLTVVVVSRLSGRVVRAVTIAVGVLLVVAIGVSRVYLGVHWPSDVLAGWLVGGLWLAICCALTARWPNRSRHATSHRFGAPVIDAGTERNLRSRYFRGEISIDVYLDHRFGTNFSASTNSSGDRLRAG